MSLKSNTLVSLLLATCAALFHVAHAADVDSKVAVQLKDGETVTQVELKQYVDRRLDLAQAATSAAGMESIAKEIGLTMALTLEGRAQGIARKSQEGEKQPPKIDDVYGLAVYKQLAPTCEEPKDEAAARQYYDQNPAAFTVPPQIRLSRIMFPHQQQVKGQPAVGWLLEKIQAVGKHETTFDEVARQAQKVYSLDPQGDLGWVSMPGENQIMRALAAAQPGDMVGPVTEGNFVYLFRIEDKHEGRLLSWNEVKASAAKRAVQYCNEQTLKKVRSDLFKKYDVTINTELIRDMFDPSNAKP